MAKKKKSVSELSDDSSKRRVKLHFHRFAKFLRYLRENRAVIKLYKGDGIRGEIEYTYYSKFKKPSNESPTIKKLVAEALNDDEKKVNDYYRTRLGTDDTIVDNEHAKKDIRKIISGVTYYLKSDGAIDEKTNTLSKKNKYDDFDLKKTIIWDSYFKKHFLSFHEYFELSIKAIFENGQSLPINEIEASFQSFDKSFLNLAKSLLALYYSKYETRHDLINSKESEEYLNKFREFISFYKDSLTKDDDVQIPFYKYYGDIEKRVSSLILLNRQIDDIEKLKISDELPINVLVEHRYAIISFLIESNLELENWKITYHSLLLLILCELFAIHFVLDNCSVDILNNDVMFNVFSTDGEAIEQQRANLNLSELSEILSRYHFNSPIEDFVKINGQNVISSRLHRYPDSHAVQNYLKDSDISNEIYSKLKNHFEKWIFSSS